MRGGTQESTFGSCWFRVIQGTSMNKGPVGTDHNIVRVVDYTKRSTRPVQQAQ